MTLSSCDRGSSGWFEGEGAVVAQEGPEDVDASSGERDDGLDVAQALAALLEVEVTTGPLADDAGLGGEVEHAAQASAVAVGSVQVPGPAAGVAGHRDESGGGGKP